MDFKNLEDRVTLIISVFFFIFSLLFMTGTALKSGILGNYLKAETSYSLTTNSYFSCSDFSKAKGLRCGTADKKVLGRVSNRGWSDICTQTYTANDLTLCAKGKPSPITTINSYGACAWECIDGNTKDQCSFIFENSNCLIPHSEGIDYPSRKCLSGYYPSGGNETPNHNTYSWVCTPCQYNTWSNCSEGIRTKTPKYSTSCPVVEESCSDSQFSIVSAEKSGSDKMVIKWNSYADGSDYYYYKIVYSNKGDDIHYKDVGVQDIYADKYTSKEVSLANISNYYYRVCYYDTGTNKIVCTHNVVYVNSSGGIQLQEVGQPITGESTPGTVGSDTCTGVNCSGCGISNGGSFKIFPSSGSCNTNSEFIEESFIEGNSGWQWQCSANGVVYPCSAKKINSCGLSSGKSFSSAPTDSLCTISDDTTVSDKGDYWSWICGNEVCSANKKVSADECGEANNGYFLNRPTEGLCKGGTPSEVDNTGTWSWTCGSVKCSAFIMVNGECVVKVGTPSETRPTTNLCKSGTANNMNSHNIGTQSAEWKWICSGINDGVNDECTAPIKTNGVCGSSDKGTFKDAPITGLCSVGKASTVSGIGPWNWTCSGFNEGKTVSCTANKITDPIVPKAECKNYSDEASYSQPTELCNKGVPDKPISSVDKWTWKCSSNDGQLSVPCFMNRIVDGKCGNSDEQVLSMAPNSGLCNPGNPSIVSGTGPWTWTCEGVNGGATDTCSASLLEEIRRGECGTADRGTFLSVPSSNLCKTGSLIGNVSGTGPWTWTCGGEGMESSSCGASIACSYSYTYGDCNNGVQSVTTKRKPELCVDTINPITSRSCKLGECNYQYTDWVCNNGTRTRELIGNYSNCSNAPLLISTCDDTINCVEDKWTCGWSDCRAYLDGYYKLYSCILEPQNDCPSVDNRKAPEIQKERCAPYGQTSGTSVPTTPTSNPSQGTSTTPTSAPSQGTSISTTPASTPTTPVVTTPSQGASTSQSATSPTAPTVSVSSSSGSSGVLPQQVIVTATTENITPECEEAGIKISRNCNTYMGQLNITDKCLSLGVKSKDLCRQLLEESGVVTKCDQLEKNLSSEEAKRQCDILINDVILGEFDNMISEETSAQLKEVEGKQVVIDAANSTIKTSSSPIPVNLPLDSSNTEVPVSLIPIVRSDDNSAQSPVAIIFDSDGNGIPDELDKRLKELGIATDSLTKVEKAIIDKKPLEQPKDKKLVSSILTVDVENSETGVRFKGKGYPNEISTLFIYSSIPIIVTVKSDDNGNWIYDLDRRLSSGKHEVYVAINDSEGRLLEASVPKMFFVAEARAISLDDYLGIQPANTSDFVEKTDSTIKNYVIGGGIVVIVLIIAFLLLKRMIVNKHEGQ